MIAKVTLSLPDKVVQDIDQDRGDVPRSRFVMRLIEKAYKQRGEKLPDAPVSVGSPQKRQAATGTDSTMEVNPRIGSG